MGEWYFCKSDIHSRGFSHAGNNIFPRWEFYFPTLGKSASGALGEVEGHLVVLKLRFLRAAEAHDDVDDLLLLAGRQLPLAMMVAVVGAGTLTEVGLHTAAGSSTQMTGKIVVESAEAPRHPYRLHLAEQRALAVAQGMGVDAATDETVGGDMGACHIVDAPLVHGALLVEAAGVVGRNHVCVELIFIHSILFYTLQRYKKKFNYASDYIQKLWSEMLNFGNICHHCTLSAPT